MSDPFQTKRRETAQAAAGTVRGLRDTGKATRERDKFTAPRKPRVGRAIQMMDVLTSGDEVLAEYLEENGQEILRRVEEAKADMELAETPEEAELFRPDPMDELLAQMVRVVSEKAEPGDAGTPMTQTPVWDAPAVDEAETDEPEPAVFDLSALKASLMDECQNAIASASLPTSEELEPPAPEMYLAECGIPGCSIHSISSANGSILHHFEHGEIGTPALRLADELLHGAGGPAYVEVYPHFVCAVDSSGAVTKYPL